MTSEQQPAGVTRRGILLGAAGGVAAALAPAASSAALAQGASVSGIVFEENNGSGNTGGPACQMCSSRTAGMSRSPTRQGRYTLPLPDEATIFVVKPSGFMPPVDPVTGSPRFYRLHQPEWLAGLAGPRLRRRRADRRRCPPRSILRCAVRTSRRNSRWCCSPIRSPNRRRKSISSART